MSGACGTTGVLAIAIASAFSVAQVAHADTSVRTTAVTVVKTAQGGGAQVLPGGIGPQVGGVAVLPRTFLGAPQAAEAPGSGNPAASALTPPPPGPATGTPIVPVG